MSPAATNAQPLVAAVMHRVRLPLLESHVAAHGIEHTREVILVAVRDHDGREGWGECPTLARPGYSPEWTDQAWVTLAEEILPAVLSGHPEPSAGPMALGSVRDAVLDLDLRRRGEGAPTLHGGDRLPSVRFGVAVGLAPTSAQVVEKVERAVAAGASSVMVKVEPGRAVGPLAAVRESYPDLAVGIDANGSFGSGDESELRDILALGPVLFEQPTAPGDQRLAARVAELARRVGAPVALDEAVSDEADLRRAVADGLGHVLTVKPARAGGFLRAQQLMRLAFDLGWSVHVGGMLESGVGRAMARLLAAEPALGDEASAGAASMVGPTPLLFAEDVVEPVGAEDGLVGVYDGPGLAPAPDPVRLSELTVERREVRP